MSELKADLQKALRGVSKQWKKKKAGRDRMPGARLSQVREYSPPRYTIRDAAFDVMEQAYNHASSNGRYYANARQVMYAARPLVLAATGGECWKDSSYFTQTLLKDYLEEFTPGWKIVWDARGHLHEPHTARGVDLGGVAVSKYMRQWTDGKFETKPITSIPALIETKGPALRYGAALFIEKEGFAEILWDAGLPNRYDLAIFSSKGLPVKAACDLAQSMEAAGVTILVARDFDLAGFKIVRTMRKGTRLAQGTGLIDIGLRLEDVGDLESEPVKYSQDRDPRMYLRSCGATDDECSFLVKSGGRAGWQGERVELNAMTSAELIAWLERKLEEHGVEKIVPPEAALAAAYSRAVFRREEARVAAKLARDLPAVRVPDDLQEQVRQRLEDHPTDAWDRAIADIVDGAA